MRFCKGKRRGRKICTVSGKGFHQRYVLPALKSKQESKRQMVTTRGGKLAGRVYEKKRETGNAADYYRGKMKRKRGQQVRMEEKTRKGKIEWK